METIIWMSMVGVYLLVALCVVVLMLMRKSNGQRRVRKLSLSPLKISLFILIGLTATGMIFMSVVVGVMIVDWPDGEPSSIVIEIPGAAGEPSWRVDDIPEQVVRDLLDENGYIVSPNQCTAKITEEHGGGFGGYYCGDTDRAVAYAYPFGSRRLYAPTTRNLQGEHGAECREAVTHLGFDPNSAEYWENIALPEYGKTVGEIKL